MRTLHIVHRFQGQILTSRVISKTQRRNIITYISGIQKDHEFEANNDRWIEISGIVSSRDVTLCITWKIWLMKLLMSALQECCKWLHSGAVWSARVPSSRFGYSMWASWWTNRNFVRFSSVILPFSPATDLILPISMFSPHQFRLFHFIRPHAHAASPANWHPSLALIFSN